MQEYSIQTEKSCDVHSGMSPSIATVASPESGLIHTSIQVAATTCCTFIVCGTSIVRFACFTRRHHVRRILLIVDPGAHIARTDSHRPYRPRAVRAPMQPAFERPGT